MVSISTRRERKQRKRNDSLLNKQTKFVLRAMPNDDILTIQAYFQTNRLREIEGIVGGNEMENYEGDYEI